MEAIRRILAAILTRLPWACEGLVLAWSTGLSCGVLWEGIKPGANRKCVWDAACTGECLCRRFISRPDVRPVYRATGYEVEHVSRWFRVEDFEVRAGARNGGRRR